MFQVHSSDFREHASLTSLRASSVLVYQNKIMTKTAIQVFHSQIEDMSKLCRRPLASPLILPSHSFCPLSVRQVQQAMLIACPPSFAAGEAVTPCHSVL